MSEPVVCFEVFNDPMFQQNGRIAYTPHNIYGSFPAIVEMLYLLCMVLRDDPYAGAATAKILNALLAVGCVFGAYVAGCAASRSRAGRESRARGGTCAGRLRRRGGRRGRR